MLKIVAKKLTKSFFFWLSCLAVLISIQGCFRESPKNSAGENQKHLAGKLWGRVYEDSRYAYPLPYRLFIPAKLDSKKNYPLILYLHASGSSRGNDNISQLNGTVATLASEKVQSIQPAFVLVPQCPNNDQWVNGDFDVPFTNYVQDNVPEADVSKMVFDVLRVLPEEFNIDNNRIYITGSSMGGSGTWDFITRHPGVFAAAVPVNGVNDPSKAELIKDLPIWAFHGNVDTIAPVDNTRSMVAELKKYGSPVKYSELKGVGHGTGGAVYGSMDMYRWLFQQMLHTNR